MPDETLLFFPTVKGPLPAECKSNESVPDLFGGGVEGRGKTIFINVETLTEEVLLRLIARNAIAAIVDLRPRPVFMKPKFQHKRVVSYFNGRGIPYVEYALLLMDERKTTSSITTTNVPTDEIIEKALNSGLALFLCDDEAKKSGLLDDARQRLKRLPAFAAELHPRALAAW